MGAGATGEKAASDDSGGCGCRAGRRSPVGMVALAAVTLFALVRRRRR